MSESVSIETQARVANKGYVQMAANLSGLVDSLGRLYRLQPGYYMPWSLVKKRLLGQMDDVFRDRGAVGLARAKQIEKFCTKILFQLFAAMLTRRHFSLFLFMHSFREYLSTQTKISEASLFDLLHQSVANNAYRTCARPQPAYLSANSWLSLLELEQQAPQAFPNLAESLTRNANKWTEYFHIEDIGVKGASTDLTEKEIDLLNDTPCEHNAFDTVQKLLVWLCARPDKTSEILSKYNVYNYGGLITPRPELDLDDAYKVKNLIN